MVVDNTNWLDLGNLFINELVGSLFLSIIILSLVIVVFCLKKNINIHTMIALLLVTDIGIAGYYYSSLGVMIAALIVSLLYYGIISRYISR